MKLNIIELQLRRTSAVLDIRMRKFHTHRFRRTHARVETEPLRLCTVLPRYERAMRRTCYGRMPIFIFLLMYDKIVAVQLGIVS